MVWRSWVILLLKVEVGDTLLEVMNLHCLLNSCGHNVWNSSGIFIIILQSSLTNYLPSQIPCSWCSKVIRFCTCWSSSLKCKYFKVCSCRRSVLSYVIWIKYHEDSFCVVGHPKKFQSRQLYNKIECEQLTWLRKFCKSTTKCSTKSSQLRLALQFEPLANSNDNQEWQWQMATVSW